MWPSTEVDGRDGFSVELGWGDGRSPHQLTYFEHGLSVRCLKESGSDNRS